MVAVQSHGMQDNNMSMKMPTKFREVKVKAELGWTRRFTK